MELWIRSQDKTILTKIDNICVIENRIVFIPSKSNGRATLGTYKTEERALEVLDEIHQRLIDLQVLECLQGTTDIQWAKNRDISCVYQMPKE